MWKRLLRILKRIGHFQSLLLLTVLYVVLWIPIGLVCRLRADWLGFKARPRTSQWWPRAARLNQPDHVKLPY